MGFESSAGSHLESGVVLRSLDRMRDLLDRSFAGVRLKAGIQTRTQVSVAALIEDVAITSAIEAAHRGLQFPRSICPNSPRSKRLSVLPFGRPTRLLAHLARFAVSIL